MTLPPRPTRLVVSKSGRRALVSFEDKTIHLYRLKDDVWVLDDRFQRTQLKGAPEAEEFIARVKNPATG
jgi:hypothetical protein